MYYSGYEEHELQPVLDLMISYLRAPVEHEAFYKKYASKKFMKGKHSTLLPVLCDHPY